MATKYGKVIAANRKRLGWTQAELGTKLNVTAQAVSKWENGNAEPDFATLQRLTELFGISVEEFFGGDPQKHEAHAESTEEVAAAAAAAVAASVAAAVGTPTIIIGYCDACKKPIEQSGDYHVYPATRGRAQRIVCKECFDKEETERRQTAYKKEQKQFRLSMVVATLVAVLIAVPGILTAIVAKDPVCLVSIGIAAAMFMFVSQCFWTSYALDLLLFFCRSFRLPGVIFTLDLGGIIFLLTVKLALCILSALLSLFLFFVGLFVSMVVGVVTFPFCLPAEIGRLKEMKKSISQI